MQNAISFGPADHIRRPAAAAMAAAQAADGLVFLASFLPHHVRSVQKGTT